MQDINVLEHQPIAWTPSPETIERAQLTRFMRQVGVSTFDELYQYSIRDVEKFTEEVLKFLDIRFDPPYTKLLDLANGPEFPNWLVAAPDAASAPKAETRPVGRVSHAAPDEPTKTRHAGLNITTMCLDRWQLDEDALELWMKLLDEDKYEEADAMAEHERPAVIWESEEGTSRTLSYGKLIRDVASCAEGLRRHGLGKGDAIGIYLPMLPETVTALLAIGRIGAVAVPVFSGYGVEAIASRMNAVGAKAIFTSVGFPRRGKLHNSRSITAEVMNLVPSLVKVFVIERILEDPETFLFCGTAMLAEADEHITMFGLPDSESQRVVGWERLCSHTPGTFNNAEPTSAEDPLIILYTSGTTGKPKGIAHTHASFPIKAAQDMAFGTDVGRGTRICWYTDLGWMMGPWLIYGALINGATICLYDGAPDYPTPDRMWEFCAKHKVEILGISPTLVRSLAAQEEQRVSSPHVSKGSSQAIDTADNDTHAGATSTEYQPPHTRHDLSSLRAFASTGEPWNPAPWWWLFEKVGDSKLPIINYSGGTEISGGILMGNPLLPQKPCSFPAPCPGMDVDILDENGLSVGPNQVGELVIQQPWIGMARGFWQERERYLDAYWRRFPKTWVHGDWAMRDSDGHWFILGRSDDTLKVAGKRVGPAEVESLLVAHPQVAEAAVIGVPDEVKGTAMVAFCVLSATNSTQLPKDDKAQKAETGAVGSVSSDNHEALQTELKTLVARDMGKPLAPSKIHFVSALPKTRNAKVMRRVLRAAYLGEDAGDLSALENPQAVDEIKELK